MVVSARAKKGFKMTHEEARKLAKEYAKSVPDDVHVPTLTSMLLRGEVSAEDLRAGKAPKPAPAMAAS